MTNIKRFASNTLILTISTILTRVIDLFSIILIARHLGVPQFGILSFAFAVNEILNIFADFGLNIYAAREIAREKGRLSQYFSNFVLLKTGITFIILVMITILGSFTAISHQTKMITFILMISMFFTSFRAFLNSIYQALQKLAWIACGNILYSGILLLGIIGVSYKDYGVNAFAILYLFSSITSFLILYTILTRQCGLKLRISVFDRILCMKSLKDAWPLAGMALFVTIYFRVDTVMLSYMKGEEAVGIYSAAYRLSEAFLILPSMVLFALFPILSDLHRNDPKLFQEASEKTIKYLFILALPVTFVVIMNAQPLINFIYNNKFQESAHALQILILAVGIMYITSALGNIIIVLNKQKVTFVMAILVTIINIGLNFLAIPKFSYLGAAATTFATELIGLAIGLFNLSRWGCRINFRKNFMGPLVAFAFSLFISWGIFMLVPNIMLFTLANLLIYAIFIYTWSLDQADKGILEKTWHWNALSWRKLCD